MASRMGTELRAEAHVGPALVLYGRLLAADAGELDELVARALNANPVLETRTPPGCPTCGRALWRPTCMHCRAGATDSARTAADEASRFDPVADDLAVVLATLTPTGRRVASYLLADVDGHGVLGRSWEQVAAGLGVPVGTVDEVVAVLRTELGPSFAAPDLGDALRILVAELPAELHRPPLLPALLDHLGLLAGGPASAAAVLDVSPSEVEDAVRFLRAHVSPPQVDLGGALPRPPVPDVLVHRTGEQLEVEVVPGPWSGLAVSSAYRRLVGPDPSVCRQLHDAQQLVDLIARRERTLLRVAELVVERQRERILHGSVGHVALTRREVATWMAVHESTVSRAVQGKLVQLPSGTVLPLADLFGTSTGVIEALRALLADGQKRTDRELGLLLGHRGHLVARRTVAKYRRQIAESAR